MDINNFLHNCRWRVWTDNEGNYQGIFETSERELDIIFKKDRTVYEGYDVVGDYSFSLSEEQLSEVKAFTIFHLENVGEDKWNNNN